MSKISKEISDLVGMQIKSIDPHVHCRDWEQSYKATIKSVTDTARAQGVVAIVDMPNTQPPIISQALVDKRLESAKSEGCLQGYYLYVGVTSNPEQIRDAVKIINSNPKVLGMKLFAGRSVGDLAVVEEEGQRTVYKTLAETGYDGVVMIHCEKEDMFKMEKWDPEKPYTWNLARPPEAEVESIKEQIDFAKEYGIKANIHICHISTPESVHIVEKARSEIRITCGITPHHLTLSSDDLQTPEDVVYKVNPPIRDSDSVEKLRALLKTGKIDWIETDHAPHSTEEKVFQEGKSASSYMSGIPSLEHYRSFLEDLAEDGFSEQQISELTYLNIKKAFPKILE